MNGITLISWMKALFPLNRSLSGDGNRETLNYLKQLVPELQIKEFPSGERVFDWTSKKYGCLRVKKENNIVKKKEEATLRLIV